MSIRVMTAVWDSDAYEGGTLLVLLALADWAADDGGKVFPKMQTLAHKARLSVRGAQVCMARLRDDGVIVEVSPARRGKGTEYKIMLDRVKDLHRNDCTAISSGEVTDAVGVQSATVGVQSDVSHIDNHQEPSVEPSYAREDAPQVGWKKVWQAFKTWPGIPAGASEFRARAAFDRMEPILPADLLDRIRAHGDEIVRQNAARGARVGGLLVTHPHNWLERDRGWEAYVPEKLPSPEQIADAKDRSDRLMRRGKYAPGMAA